MDEIQYRKGHHYLTLLYQIDTHRRRLLWMGEGRTKKTLNNGFTELEQEHQRKQEAAGEKEPTSFLGQIAVICSDIWKAYLNVIGKRLPAAVHILDRFHIMQHFSKALDKVRAQEPRRLKEEGKDPVLCKSRSSPAVRVVFRVSTDDSLAASWIFCRWCLRKSASAFFRLSTNCLNRPDLAAWPCNFHL